jgi:hypothetical protein
MGNYIWGNAGQKGRYGLFRLVDGLELLIGLYSNQDIEENL